MAKRQRLNKRLVIVLAGLAVLAGLFVCGWAVMRQSRTPEFYAQRAAEAMEKNDYAGAVRAYSDAVKYSQTNQQRVKYLLDEAETINAWRANDPALLQNQTQWLELFRASYDCYQKAHVVDHNDLTVLRKLADAQLERCRLFSNPDWIGYVETMEQIRALDANDTDALFRLAQAKAELSKSNSKYIDEAEKEFVQVVQAVPTNEEYWSALARFRNDHQHAPEAEQTLADAVARNPGSIRLRLEQANLLRSRADKSKTKQADEIIAQALAIKPADADNAVALAEYCRVNSDMPRAVLVLNDAAQRFGDNHLPFMLRAQILEAQGKNVDADADYAKCLELLRADMAQQAQVKNKAESKLGWYQRELTQADWMMADALLDRIARDRNQKDALLPRVREAQSEINAANRHEVPASIYIAGRIAHMDLGEGENSDSLTAERKFRDVVSSIPLQWAPSLAVLKSAYYLADIYQSQNQLGEAGQMLARANAIAGGKMAALELRQIRLLLAMRKYGEGRPGNVQEDPAARLRTLLDTDNFKKQPNEIDEARMLQLGLKALTVDPPRVPAELRQLDGQLTALLSDRARRLWWEGQYSQAMDLLEDIQKRQKADVSVAAQLIKWRRQTRRPDELAKAEALRQEMLTGPLAGDPAARARLEDILTDKQPDYAGMIKQFEQQKDDFLREMNLARAYFALSQAPSDDAKAKEQNKAKYMEHLRLAETAKPKHPAVVGEMFAYCVRESDWDNAAKYADQAAQINLDTVGGCYFKARLAAARKQYAQAIQLTEEAIKARPYLSNLHALLGELCIFDNQLARAKTETKEALDLNPADLQALTTQINLTAGNSPSEYQEAVKQAYAIAWSNGRVTELKLQIDESKAADEQVKNPSLSAAITAAVLRHREHIAREQPENLENLDRLAALYEKGGNKEAENIYRRIMEQSKNAPDSVSAMGRYLLRTKRQSDALLLLNDYAKTASDKLVANLMLGDFYLTAGQKENAKAAYDAAVARDANDPRPSARLAEYYRLNNQPDEQVQSLRKALTLAGDKAEPERYESLVETLADQGKASEAQAAFDAIPAGRLGELRMVFMRGYLAMKRGDKDPAEYAKALELLGQAKEDANVGPRALLARSDVYTRLQRWDEAIGDLETARQKSAGSSTVLIRLAELYAVVRRDPDRAIGLLKEVRASEPDNLLVLEKLASLSLGKNAELFKDVVDDGKKRFPQEKFFPRMAAEAARVGQNWPAAVASLQSAAKLSDQPDKEIILALMQVYLEWGKTTRDKNDEAISLAKTWRQDKEIGATITAMAALAQMNKKDASAADAEFAAALQAADSRQLVFVVEQIKNAYGQPKDMAKLQGWLDLRSEGKNWEMYFIVGSLALERNLTDQGIALLTKAHDLAADLPEAQKLLKAQVARQLGMAHYTAKHFPESLRYYDEALAVEQDVGTLNNKAWLVAVDMHKPAEAVAAAKLAYERSGYQSEIADTYGYVLYLKGEYDNGRQVLAKSMSQRKIAAGLLHLGMCYEQLNMKKEAGDAYDQAWQMVKDNPKDHDYQEIKDRLDRINVNKQ